MNVEVTKLPESRVALKIELTADEVDQALTRTYRQLVQRVNVPGFRKGKAPRAVVERAIGPEIFRHEGTEDAIRWGYRAAIEQEKLVPLDEAEIQATDHDDHLEPGQSFQFEATVSVKPEVQLPDYRSMRVSRSQADVTDKDVEALVDTLRERNATLEPVQRPADLGDVLTMNIAGRVEGQEVLNQDDFDFTLRDESAEGPDPTFPGLPEKLAGAKPGDIEEIALPLPEMYADRAMAGKTVALRILIKEVKRKVLPPADDDLAQSVSELKTLSELKDALRSNLELERRLEADEKLVTAAVEEVSERTFVEIPPILIEEEVTRMLDEMRRSFEQANLSLQTYFDTANRTEADVRNEMRESATRNVKTSLVLGAVAEAEHIEVSGAEVQAALNQLLGSAEVPESERRQMRSSSAVRSSLRGRIRRQRAIQKLVEIMSDGEEVSDGAAEAMADQSTDITEDAEEAVPVEAG